MRDSFRFRHFLSRLSWLALVLVAAGCASPAPKKPLSGVFFPPPPELPRLQFLTSFTGSKDVQSQSGFDKFVIGEEKNIRLDKPYGVALHDGKVYVCDTNSSVAVFDLQGRKFGLLKGATGQGKLVAPVNISIAADGTKFVADPGRGQVLEYDRADEYVRSFVAPGEWRPVDAVRFEERLYVADSTKAKVWVFDLQSGEVVKSIGNTGAPDERLDRPTNLAFDKDGDLYVSDAGRFQVVKYDRDGHYKAVFGKLGDNPSHFARPKGVALDRDGHLYAVDAAFQNVQMFDPLGRLLLFFGGGGDAPGKFLLPAQVAIDYDNAKYFAPYVAPGFEVQYLVLVTSQFGDRAVSVFAYGREKGRKYPTDEELLKELDEARRKAIEKEVKPEAPPEKPEVKPPGE